ncbi:cytochrome P450 oxidoreductase [Halenospora varia]|nr:cytochrome P450 oxidoreductase [Halenospora varia]
MASFIPWIFWLRGIGFFQSVLICVLGTFVAIIIYKVIRDFASPLRHLPGPFIARFSRFWIFREARNGTFHLSSVKLHQKYGPIVRVAPNQFSINDPAAVKIIYGPKTAFRKSSWYLSSSVPGTPHSIFVDPDIKRHGANRRQISSAYSMSTLVQLEPFIDHCTSILRARLDDFVASKRSFDLPHWMQCYAFDVIGQITVGERFGFLDCGEDIQRMMQSLEQTLVYAAWVGQYPEFHPILFFINAVLFSNMKGIMNILNFVNDAVKKRLEKPAPPKDNSLPIDFITRFMYIQSENSTKLSNKDIMESSMANIGAGSDTTGVSLTSIMYHVFQNPGVLQQLRKELDEAAMRGALSKPATFKETQQLPYLQAVIKEALRIHPAAGLTLGRVVPQGGCVIADQHFSEGTTVGINAWVAHANQDVYGRDADLFRPERWLEEPNVVKVRDAYFMTFGSGSRTCLGKNISLLELAKVVPEIVQNYDVEPEIPDQVLRTENVWFVKQKDYPCRIRSRVRSI